jgi:hypothetical protein
MYILWILLVRLVVTGKPSWTKPIRREVQLLVRYQLGNELSSPRSVSYASALVAAQHRGIRAGRVPSASATAVIEVILDDLLLDRTLGKKLPGSTGVLDPKVVRMIIAAA